MPRTYRKKEPEYRRCQYCGAVFQSKSSRAKYCSASCRTMACYQRNGYRYESGGYVKPDLPQANEPPETEALRVVPTEEKEQSNQPHFGRQVLATAAGTSLANILSEGVKSAGYTSQDRKKLLDQLMPWLRQIEQNQHSLYQNQRQLADVLNALRGEIRKR